MRKTKIICTIGPASDNEETLSKMCEAGMNVARLNFSHGTHEQHQEKIDLIKRVRSKLNLPIAIMLDTKGPEYRMHSVIGSVGFKDFGKNGYKLLENDEKQTIHVRLGGPSDGYLYPLGKNPLRIKYPQGTTFQVFYDPAHPKRGYVKRYCDKRFMFWILSGTAIFCFVLGIFIFLMFYLFG